MGGKSSEHDVSLISAKTVIESIDKDRYSVIMVGITKDGQWKLIDTIAHLEDGSWVNSKTSAYICPVSFIIMVEWYQKTIPVPL